MPPADPRQKLPDPDHEETDEWLESLRSVTFYQGQQRARILLHELMAEAKSLEIPITSPSRSPYVNSVALEQQPPYPGDLEKERRIQNAILWNAAVMFSIK